MIAATPVYRSHKLEFHHWDKELRKAFFKRAKEHSKALLAVRGNISDGSALRTSDKTRQLRRVASLNVTCMCACAFAFEL